MKNNTKIYNRFKGFTLEDCLADECVCAEEIRQAKERCRRERSF